MVILSVVLVLVVVLAGCGIVVASTRKRRPFASCGKCGYDVTATVGSSPRCPECGAQFTEVGVRPPERVRGAMLAAGLAIVLGGGCLGAGALSSIVAYREAAIARQQALRAVLAQQQQRQAALQQAEADGEDATESAEPPSGDEQE